MIYKESGTQTVQSLSSNSANSRWIPDHLTGLTYLEQLPISFTFWTEVVVLKGGQVLVSDASRGYVLPLPHYFICFALDWYPWALFAPFVLALALRRPFTRSN